MIQFTGAKNSASQVSSNQSVQANACAAPDVYSVFILPLWHSDLCLCAQNWLRILAVLACAVNAGFEFLVFLTVRCAD